MRTPKINRTMRMTNENQADPRALTTEEKLRLDNSGLQELWDQYQTMLKLLMPAKAEPHAVGRPIKRKKLKR